MTAQTRTSGSIAEEAPQLLDKLHKVFGFRSFRGVQQQVVDRVMAGQSTLAVMPTGAGKSLTYQLPATMLEGTCVVMRPNARARAISAICSRNAAYRCSRSTKRIACPNGGTTSGPTTACYAR